MPMTAHDVMTGPCDFAGSLGPTSAPLVPAKTCLASFKLITSGTARQRIRCSASSVFAGARAGFVGYQWSVYGAIQCTRVPPSGGLVISQPPPTCSARYDILGESAATTISSGCRR
jgi:hypothetical protein